MSRASQMRAGGSTALLVALVLAVAPTGAGAATTLGQTFAPGSCASNTYIQTISPANNYRAPHAGVITSWSHQAGPVAPTQLRLKIARPGPGANFAFDAPITIVGQSDLETVAVAGAVRSYPSRVPVQAGDMIGYFINASTVFCSRNDATYTDHYDPDGIDQQPGS